LLLAAIVWIMLMLIGHVRAEALPQPKVLPDIVGAAAPMNDRAPAAVPKGRPGAYCIEQRRR
jgi:hypothetical protein